MGLLALCLMSLTVLHQADRAEYLVGVIKIEGNTVTRDQVIINRLKLYPGQKVKLADVRAAQERLRASGLFAMDPERGTGPTVGVLPSGTDSPVLDIQVRVVERRAKR